MTIQNDINRGLADLIKISTKNEAKTTKSKGMTGLTLGTDTNYQYLDFIDITTGTPCLPMEWLFGTRGMLTGRLAHAKAKEGVGKSSLCFLLYGMFQRTGGVWLNHQETEMAMMPPDRIAHLGCDPSTLLMSQPNGVTGCFEKVKQVTKALRNGPDAEMKYPIVHGIDSISSLSDAEVDMESGDKEGGGSIAAHAKEFSKFFRDNLLYLEQNRSALITSAQTKQGIAMPGNPGGGGDSHIAATPVAFHASWIFKMTKTKIPDQGGFSPGEMVTITSTKNKLAPKNRSITPYLYSDERGWDFTAATCQLLFNSHSPFEPGTYRASSGWYAHDEIKDGKNCRGDEFVELFYQNEDLVMRSREKLKIRGFGFAFEDITPLEDTNPLHAEKKDEKAEKKAK